MMTSILKVAIDLLLKLWRKIITSSPSCIPFLSETSRGKTCRYVVHWDSGGFGNRMQGLLSTFLYAIMTNRTLIVLRDGDESFFCEPFKSSTWFLNPEHEKKVMGGLRGEQDALSVDAINYNFGKGEKV